MAAQGLALYKLPTNFTIVPITQNLQGELVYQDLAQDQINSYFSLEIKDIQVFLPIRSTEEGIKVDISSALEVSHLLNKHYADVNFANGTLYASLKARSREAQEEVTMRDISLPTTAELIAYIFAEPECSRNFFLENFSKLDPANNLPQNIPEESKTSILVMYYLSAFCTVFPLFLKYIFTTNAGEDAGVCIICQTHVAPDRSVATFTNILSEAFLLVAYMTKSVTGDNITNDFSRRSSALFKGSIQVIPQRSASALRLRRFWLASPTFRKIFTNYLVNPGLLNGEFSHKAKITEFVDQCKLLMNFAGMKLVNQAYIYILARPILLLEPVFAEQAYNLKTKYEALQTAKGELFPYIRLLEDSVPDLNIAQYADVAFATIKYYASVNKTWRNFAELKHPTSLPQELLTRNAGQFITTTGHLSAKPMRMLTSFEIDKAAVARARAAAKEGPEKYRPPPRAAARRGRQ